MIAAGQLAANLGALSKAAFMLRRAEISNRQLGAYQRLSIDLLEYIRVAQATPLSSNVATVLADLADLDSLGAAEVGLVAENGGHADNDAETLALVRIRGAIASLSTAPTLSIAAAYENAVRPLLAEAVDRERSEVEDVMRSMAALQTRMRIAGPIGALLQLATASLTVWFIARLVLDPLSRLVADIRLLGRGTLAHRVAVGRRDEIGLLAQNFNRMAAALERGRHRLVRNNDVLESTVRDRTRALSERNEELKEIDASRRRFFADVSHELRTPLTAIVGEADVTLRIAQRSVGPYREALDSILANSTYLNRRIDDLMALERSFDGRVEVDHRVVDLDKMAGAAVADISTLARINGVTIRLDLPEQALSVRGDRDRLRQCLMILLDSAVKSSRGAEIVVLSIGRDRGNVAVSVTDESGSIAEEDLSRVFELYYRTEVGRRKGGTGLGFAIARRIADAHGGAIEAFRTSTGGTRVTLSLPLDGKEIGA